MRAWLSAHLLLISTFSALAFLAGIAGVLVVAVCLPEDYFTRAPSLAPRASATGKILKNVAGGLILLLGALMALPLVPGPGVVLMLIGLSIMDFPGKRRIEIQLLRIPGLLSQLNKLRAALKHPPLIVPGKKEHARQCDK